ncbi:hypothetical protein ANANG_G00042480 [Anguilla anguilla]|uniref:Uncharacterized protein n=1 Tax=Anguilla anguilla TaxID=7936 RepID=A0A9D3S9H5_ANGAN|nr:hypothetical protein ANANG_G00042480 [Anguilla anguilla]
MFFHFIQRAIHGQESNPWLRRGDLNVGPWAAAPDGKLDGVQVRDRAPHLGDQTLLGDVDVAEVERVIDGLHLPDLDEPHPHCLGRSLEDPLTMILRLVQHLEVHRDAGHLGRR